MIAFSPAALAEYEGLRQRYPNARSMLLPVLWLAQREFRVITKEVADYIGNLLSLSPADVYSVASFYTMYNKEPVGEYHIQVCRNVSCFMFGCRGLVERLRSRLGIEEGETTPDGKFTLSTVECLGSCDTAPMMQINERYYENLTLERVDNILAELKKRDERVQPGTSTVASQHRPAEPGSS
jgi:NADH-quinone oxidoreductase E subunit